MSAPSRTSIVSFNAGELSPYLDARVDQEKYRSGCRELQNAILEIYGAARRRPGLQFIAEAKFHTKKCRLEDFRFSTTTTFTLEVGDEYMRFFSNGAQVAKAAPAAWVTATPYVVGDFVTNGGFKYYCVIAHTSAAAFATDLAAVRWVLQSIYEIPTPWEEADLFDLQFAQINDVTYIAHPDYPVQKLSRVADDDWTLEEVNFLTPALLDENLEDTITISSSATALGATVLTAVGGTPFQAGHVGAYFQLAHLRPASFVEINITVNGTSASVRTLGQWNVRTYGIWAADILVQKSTDNGATWTTVRSFSGRSDRNVDAVGTADEEALYQLVVANWVSATATPRVIFEVVDSYVYGLVKVTGYTSPTVVDGTIVKVLHSTAATPLWSEGAWSDVRGYPRAVTLHEQRLVFGGTEFQAQTIWGSVVGDYENFAYGTLDTDAYNYTIGAKERNAIQWLSSHTALLIGTAGGEWVMSSGDDVNPISPTNVVAKRQSNYGSSGIGALLVNDVTLFIQRQARRVREMTYALENDRYVASDLTILAEHITLGGLIQIAYQQQRNSIVWGVTADGKLIGLTYEREQSVVGWHRHVTAGTFESVATVYGSGEDEVWVVANRTIGGVTKRYIERFNPTEWTAKEDAFFVDSGLSYSGVAVNVLGGLTHLIGKTVSILGDGAVFPDQVVSGAGTVTLPGGATVTKAHIGLPFTTIINPMRLDVDNIVGITQGQTKRISELNLRFLNTLGCKVGDTFASARALSFRDTGMAMDESPPLFTGDKQYEFDGDFDYDVPVFIVQDQPLPLTLLAIVIRYEVSKK